MVLDLEQLRSLVALADTGSSRGAALRVHKTDSAVSLHLAKLARAVGCRLVQRSGRRLVLTADGEELLRHARRILSAHDEAVGVFQTPLFHGQLRVGLPDDYIPVLMGPLLQSLQRVVPRAHLEVTCAPSAELRPQLADGRLDMAILSAETDTQEGLVLRTERVVWVAAPGLQADMPVCVPLALFPEGCIFRKWAVAQLRQHQREHRVVCTSRSMLAIQAAVGAGFAVAVVAASGVPRGAEVMSASSGFEPLPDVTVILAGASAMDPGLVRRLAEDLRQATLHVSSA